MPPLPALPLLAAAFIAQSPTPPAAPSGTGTSTGTTNTAPSAATPPPVAPLSWALFAQDPLVQDPVSFCVADDGSLFIAESFRQEKGVEDNRSSKFWLEDDLQLQSVEDRLKMYEKWASKREGGMDYYRKEEDRVTHLVDTNGDGVPDKVTSFSGPMNDPLDGTGAGVAVIDGSVWYTCIPSLWRFQDTKAPASPMCARKCSPASASAPRCVVMTCTVLCKVPTVACIGRSAIARARLHHGRRRDDQVRHQLGHRLPGTTQVDNYLPTC
jgi:hypothetical protein